MTELITVTQATEITGIPRSTLYRIIRRGELPAKRIGAKFWIHREAIRRFTDSFDEEQAGTHAPKMS